MSAATYFTVSEPDRAKGVHDTLITSANAPFSKLLSEITGTAKS